MIYHRTIWPSDDGFIENEPEMIHHKNILIVDDDPTIHAMYQHILANRQYRFFSCVSALDGLKTLEQENIDIILLDMMMPEMNGIEFMKRYQQQAQTAEIPCIIISATGDRRMIDEAYQQGAITCLTKPFSAPLLIENVQAALGDHRMPRHEPSSGPELDQTPLEEKLASAWSRLSFFHHITKQMRSINDPQALIREALINASDLLGVQYAGLVYANAQQNTNIWSDEGFSRIDCEKLIQAQAQHSHKPLLCQSYSACRVALPQGPALYSLIGIQLETQYTSECYLFVANKQNQASFNAGDILFFESLAEQITTILETRALQHQTLRTQEIKHELQMAAEIQTRFLAQDLQLAAGYDAAAMLISASQVGGDFYDALQHESVSSYFLCDMAGKGIPAALVAAELRMAIRASILQNPPEPGLILHQANKLLYESMSRTDYMATACLVQIMEDEPRLRYASAGHTSALLYKKQSAEIETLNSTCLLLGLFPEVETNHTEHLMELGDVLLIYSDGLSETENSDGQIMGMSGIRDVMMATHLAPASIIQDALIKATQHFRERHNNADDLTTLVIKRPDPSEAAILLSHYLYLQADLKNLPQIDLGLREISAGLGQPEHHETWLMEVVLAATENLSNVIRHSRNKIRPDIHIFIALYADRLVIDIYDLGDPYEPQEVKPLLLDIDDLQEGGYGLHVIHQIMDEVRYTRIAELYNHWHLMRYRPDSVAT